MRGCRIWHKRNLGLITGLSTLAVMLQGCMTTPQDIVQEDRRLTAASLKPPAEAALCLQQELENKRGFLVSQRPLGERPGFEVNARMVAGLYTRVHTLLVIHVEPQGTGSAMTIWTAPGMTDSFVKRITDRC